MCEATPKVKELLERLPTHIPDRSCGRTGQAPFGNVQGRDHFEHLVILGTDHEKGDMLMASRTNNCEGVKLNYADHWVDDKVRVEGENKLHLFKRSRAFRRASDMRYMLCVICCWMCIVGHVDAILGV